MAIMSPVMTVMQKAARKAARALARDFGEVEQLQVSMKGPADFVTAADKKAEQIIFGELSHARPGYGFLMEERGAVDGPDSGYTWIIDPIDGTKSFISGVPFYGVLLALVRGEQPLLGVTYFPALDDMIYATRGGGCYWNGRPARVSAVARLADAVLLASDLNNFAPYNRQDAFQRLIDATYFQRTWGDAYGYALVATGRAEVMLDPAMALWDCGPLQVILEEAGGTFTDWRGTPTIFGGEAVATNGALFAPVMELIGRS